MIDITKEQVEARLKEDVIPSLVRQGKFGDGMSTKEVRVEFMAEGSGHWASSSCFVEVDMIRQDGSTWTKHLVVKHPPLNEFFRHRMKSDLMYENETSIYNEVIPSYRRFLEEQANTLQDERITDLGKDLVPDCYFAEFRHQHPEDSIVVLENMKYCGYQCAEVRTGMDWAHVAESLKLIGRYHGISYAYQEKKSQDFDRLVSLIKPTRYFKEDRILMELSMVAGTQRAVLRLLKDGWEDIKVEELKKLNRIFEDIFDITPKLTVSGERRVLCHGDFCSNNILYQYGEQAQSQDAPVAAVLVDFQTPYYSSPAIDLAFFLYTNTDYEFRLQHFHEALQLYHDTVCTTVSTILGRPLTEEKFTKSAFMKDFADHALYGYMICGFFLPVMIMIKTEPFDLEEDFKRSETIPRTERIEELLKRGGEEAEQELVQVFKEFYGRGFFKKILEDH